MVMRKVLMLCLSLFVFDVSYAQLPDIPTIEAFIAIHKKKYDGLGSRKDRAAKNSGLAVSVESVTDDVEELQTNLSKRMADSYAYLNNAQTAISIITELQKTTKLVDEYVSFFFDNVFSNAMIYKWYENSINGIKEEINKCTNIIVGGVLTKGTHKQKFECFNEILESLELVNRLMERTLWMCNGIISLDMSYSKSWVEIMSSPSFQSKVDRYSEELIESYKKNGK